MIAKYAIINQTSIAVAKAGLDAYAMRSKATANNMANITTPGYKRIEVSFEESLQQYLDPNLTKGERTHHNHFRHGRPELDMVQPRGYRSEDLTMPGEVNNVDVDIESSKMAENQMMFNFGVKFIQERMAAISQAIKVK